MRNLEYAMRCGAIFIQMIQICHEMRCHLCTDDTNVSTKLDGKICYQRILVFTFHFIAIKSNDMLTCPRNKYLLSMSTTFYISIQQHKDSYSINKYTSTEKLDFCSGITNKRSSRSKLQFVPVNTQLGLFLSTLNLSRSCRHSILGRSYKH